MKLLFISGPFRAETPWLIEQNIRRAEEVGLEVCKRGASCVIPHTCFRFFQSSLPDSFWLNATLEQLRRCDAVVLTPIWMTSEGTKAEIKEARKLGKPIFIYSTSKHDFIQFNEDGYMKTNDSIDHFQLFLES